MEPPSLAPGAFVNDRTVFLITEPRVPPRPHLDVRMRQAEESFRPGGAPSTGRLGQRQAGFR